jgi:cell division protein FtsB
MDSQTLRGLVYLFLILAGGAALWIFILYLVLGRARRRIAALETENKNLKRRLEDMKTRIETRSMDDVELLKGVTDLLGDL